MKDLTVVIPTAGRPDYLRTCFDSLRRQPVRERLAEILVSENKADRRSEAVAQQYPDLPIRYVFREPPSDMITHIYTLLGEPETPYISLLNDDDWWAPGFLNGALLALDSNPGAVAYGNASLFVNNERDDHPLYIQRSDALWLICGKPSFSHLWTLDAPAMYTAGWVYTAFHWSSLVCRKGPLRNATRHLLAHRPPALLTDRYLLLAISDHGPFLFEPFAQTYVRWHATNFIKDKKREDLRRITTEEAENIATLAERHGVKVVQRWHELLAGMPPECEEELLTRLHESLSMEAIREYGLHKYFTTRIRGPRETALRNIAANAKNLAGMLLHS